MTTRRLQGLSLHNMRILNINNISYRNVYLESRKAKPLTSLQQEKPLEWLTFEPDPFKFPSLDFPRDIFLESEGIVRLFRIQPEGIGCYGSKMILIAFSALFFSRGLGLTCGEKQKEKDLMELLCLSDPICWLR